MKSNQTLLSSLVSRGNKPVKNRAHAYRHKHPHISPLMWQPWRSEAVRSCATEDGGADVGWALRLLLPTPYQGYALGPTSSPRIRKMSTHPSRGTIGIINYCNLPTSFTKGSMLRPVRAVYLGWGVAERRGLTHVATPIFTFPPMFPVNGVLCCFFKCIGLKDVCINWAMQES